MHTVQAQQLVRAEIGRELAGKVNLIRKVEGVSFKRSWELAKQRFPALFAEAARIEAQTAKEDDAVECEGAFIDYIDGKPVAMPLAYNDPWYH